MKVIIQKDIFEKGKIYFLKSDLELLVYDLTEEEKMINAQRRNSILCFIIGPEKYSNSFYNSLNPGSLVIRFGVGYENIPIEICRKRVIYIAYTPGTLNRSVAEHAMALILNCAKMIPKANSLVKKSKWNTTSGIELYEKKLAIIGFGNIGRETAKIAKYGFNMIINALDISPFLEEQLDFVDLYSNDFEKVVADADFVSLHMSINNNTRSYIDYNKLKLMKKNAFLINTSRGKLINETDLFKAMKNKTIKGAALDVFINEPYVPIKGNDLRKLDNIILTPHISSNTDNSNRRMSEMCISNALNYYKNDLGQVKFIPESKPNTRK